jgi:hypothetical protein
MKRAPCYSLIGAFLVAIAAVYLLRVRAQELTPSELALAAAKVPTWTDYDCAKFQNILDAAVASEPLKRGDELGADEIAIYRAILPSPILPARKESGARINLANKTYPLSLHPGAACMCFRGIDLESFDRASRSYHELPEYLLPGKDVRLADPEEHVKIVRKNDPERDHPGKSLDQAVDDAFATGLFSISEIAFDKEHRRAVVSYSFVCGSLCGNGKTLVFEKVNGEWKETDQTCGGWIS